MVYMERVYKAIIKNHMKHNRQMIFISGPRQVGKTTVSKSIKKSAHYFDWDDKDDRINIIRGQKYVAREIGEKANQTIIFDELHKYDDWKNFIKGFFDKYTDLGWKIIVTGSSKLDTYRKGGDSLAGRYFHYQMHPLSIAELVYTGYSNTIIKKPEKISDSAWEALIEFGGFPEPFLKGTKKFHRQWIRTRQNQLFQEEIRSLGGAYDVAKVEVLAELINFNAANSLNYTSYANSVRASVESIQRWIILLEQLSYCFRLRPWTKNISRSIKKEPKIFLIDWSQIDDIGKRNENFIASSLLKAIQGWNDLGLGEFTLNFIRTKEKREVDFVISKDKKPWILVEAKTSETGINNNLEYFQNMLGAEHAFQVTMNLPFEDFDCFKIKRPVIVPARTFLSQLL